jgi:hypothetical protein
MFCRIVFKTVSYSQIKDMSKANPSIEWAKINIEKVLVGISLGFRKYQRKFTRHKKSWFYKVL